MSSTLIGIRDDTVDGLYSPAKQKAANRGNYTSRSALFLRRAPQLLAAVKFKLLLAFSLLCLAIFLSSKLSSFMGWIPDRASLVSSPYRGSYTVLINTWRRNSPLKRTAAHYASCVGADAIHVVWSEIEPPSERLKSDLDRAVKLKSWRPDIRVEIEENGGGGSGRFKPIDEVRTDAIFSVDDDVIVPCSSLEFAFSVWKTAPLTMVGFVPRMHWLDLDKSGGVFHRYGGWLSVWWMGSYSMVLSKAAFFHKKYLDLYTNEMPSPLQDYLARERNCEDIAMSMVVANASGTPPLWVKGKIQEIGSWGTSNGKGKEKRNECLNDLLSFYETVPLLSTNVKIVNARQEWVW
ncbi:unnamed protein product [Linum tenue]|uniref:Glycosyl transferase 64 domain-containing protein n=2 Tax=Linum tenue TaxID=586396 RepID=A0AAV0J314_9ROSI|nr:unnamed protein product [Linum tenue]